MRVIKQRLPILPFVRVAARDAFRIPYRVNTVEKHLDAAIAWLVYAHDRTTDGGVSYGYSLKGGWRPSYIETTGYIAETFFDLAAERKEPDFEHRAFRMAKWLCSIQNENGSFSNPRYGQNGIVFDTGQDLSGLVRAAIETRDERFLNAAKRAGDWLSKIADSKGRWTRCTHNGIPHVYNSRVAWALLAMNRLEPRDRRESVARANLDWAVAKQQQSGLFAECAFERGVAPFTHTVAYAIRGLWESGEILDDNRYRQSAMMAADALLQHVGDKGFIPGQISVEGKSEGDYCCLTGNAQLAIIWGKLYLATGRQRYREAAIRALRYVMSTQNLTTDSQDRFGAIKGSHPIWGRYSPFTYPNWATKFFIDALSVCGRWMA